MDAEGEFINKKLQQAKFMPKNLEIIIVMENG